MLPPCTRARIDCGCPCAIRLYLYLYPLCCCLPSHFRPIFHTSSIPHLFSNLCILIRVLRRAPDAPPLRSSFLLPTAQPRLASSLLGFLHTAPPRVPRPVSRSPRAQPRPRTDVHMGSSQAAPLPPPPAVKPRWSQPSFWSWSQAASRETLGSGMRLGRGTGMGAHVCCARVCTSRIVHGYV